MSLYFLFGLCAFVGRSSLCIMYCLHTIYTSTPLIHNKTTDPKKSGVIVKSILYVSRTAVAFYI